MSILLKVFMDAMRTAANLLRQSALLLLIALGARPAFARTRAPQPLTENERSIIRTALEPAIILPRKHIILVWPRGLSPQWYPEAPVRNPGQMADWLEHGYQLMASWTRYDPDAHYEQRTHSHDRLIFIHNGQGDFVFGGVASPFVGLRDLKNPPAGSEDWFGWLSHEMSHDFWHEHPAFEKSKVEWGEAMCDYSRYYLLGYGGMPQAAGRWRAGLQRANPDDKYRGGAFILLHFDESHHLRGPAGLWSYLWNRNFDEVLGKPAW